jgi:prolyl-tRNA synthetase
VHIIATGKDDAPFDAADALANELDSNGLRVLFDDRRGVSPGVKFNDSELLGVPTIVVIGRSLGEGLVEVRNRRTGAQELVALDTVVSSLIDMVAVS